MDFKVEKLDKPNELKLEFTIEASVFEEGIKKVFVKNAKYFNIPGFRKGKAPYNIVEKHYGKEIFYEDAFNEVVPPIYENAIKEKKLDVVSRPVINITKMEKGQDLIFTATVQTKPEVKLGAYKGIELNKVEYKVTNEDIDKEVESLASKNARIVSVEDRALEQGDIAIIDFEGFVDGKAFDGGKAENYELTIGSHSFIEGFEDQLVGMKPEAEKEIKVKFPDEYFSKDLSGKPASFKVKLHEIKKKEMPKIDDELAKDISEFDTLEELKKDIQTKKEKENADRARYEIEDEAIKTVTDNVEIDIPSGMIETETHNMLHNIEDNLMYQGIKFDQYLSMIGKKREDLQKEYETEARATIKERLVLAAIAKEEKIEPTETEMKDKIKEVVAQYGKKEEDVKDNEDFKNHIKDIVRVEKTIKFIVDNAKFVEKKEEKATKSAKTAEAKKEAKSESKEEKAEAKAETKKANSKKTDSKK